MVVEWDAREMGAAARGRGERERLREEKSIYFLSTNLKFEAFLEGEEEFSDQGRLAKGIIVCIL